MSAFNKFAVAIFLIILTLGARSKDFDKSLCTNDLEALAIELLHMDLNGARISDEQIKSCSVPMINSLIVRQIHEEPNEEYATKLGVEAQDKFIIKSIERLDNKQFHVSFTIDRNGKEILKDTFIMLKHKSEKKIKKYGCAEFLSFPDAILTHASCL